MENLNLKFLANEPIEIINIGKVYPLTLREIARIGENKYYQYLNILGIDPEQYLKETKEQDEILKNLSSFDILMMYCLYNDSLTLDIKNMILEAIRLFFKEEVSFTLMETNPLFYFGEIQDGRFITRENYENIKDIILKQNCYKKKKEEEFKPANEAATKLVEKIKAMRNKRPETNLTLFDLISVLAANSNNLNILTVWELSMFQFNDQFNRMQMIEDFEININSLLHGADSKKINLKHYIRKIDTN